MTNPINPEAAEALIRKCQQIMNLVDEYYAEPTTNNRHAIRGALLDALTANTPPAVSAEPVAFGIFDSQGFYESRASEAGAKQFCEHYNRRPIDPLKPYSYRPLYDHPAPQPQPSKAEPPAAQALGKCCYGGHKPKSACGSCAAWTPRGEALHKAAADAFEFLGERFGMSEDANRPEAHRIWAALRAALAASPAAGPQWIDGEPANLVAAAEDASEWLALIERLHLAGKWKFSQPDTLARLRGCAKSLRSMLSAPLVSGSGTAQSQDEQGKAE